MARRSEILFPFAGVDKASAYGRQPPLTTPYAMNVRPRDASEGRARGGSRLGLKRWKPASTEITQTPVRMMGQIITTLGAAVWKDQFNRPDGSLGAAWEWDDNWTDPWEGGDAWDEAVLYEGRAVAPVSQVLPNRYGNVVMVNSLDIGDLDAFQVSMVCQEFQFQEPYEGTSASYRLYLFMDNDNPDVTDEGVIIDVATKDQAHVPSLYYHARLRSYIIGNQVTDINFDEEMRYYPPLYNQPNLVQVSCGFRQYGGGTDWEEWAIRVTMNGVLLLDESNVRINVASSRGNKMGFGIACTVPPAQENKYASIDDFTVEYSYESGVDEGRERIVYSSGGNVYFEEEGGGITQATLNATLESGLLLMATATGQDQLFIADYASAPVASGTDGLVVDGRLEAVSHASFYEDLSLYDHVCTISNATGDVASGVYSIEAITDEYVALSGFTGDEEGSCHYRFDRGPKVFDYSQESLEAITATSGTIPIGCPIIAYFSGRLVLAGAPSAPHVWYMSRVNDPYDWDYSQEDDEAAVAGNQGYNSPLLAGQPITAMAPHSDDYLVIGCTSSLWVLRGDPRFGGSLANLSRTIGIVDKGAWCWGPSGELVFLSFDGLYYLPAGATAYPMPLSRERLPEDLRAVNVDQKTVLMSYDHEARGVNIWLTPNDAAGQTHWFFDWVNSGFWPQSFPSNSEATALVVDRRNGVTLHGCRDGGVRTMTLEFTVDSSSVDGQEQSVSFAESSYCLYTPIRPGNNATTRGMVQTIEATLDDNSGDVAWLMIGANSHEELLNLAYSIGAWLTEDGDMILMEDGETVFGLEGFGQMRGEWSAGPNYRGRPMVSGTSAGLFVQGLVDQGVPWAIEKVTVQTQAMGQQRLL